MSWSSTDSDLLSRCHPHPLQFSDAGGSFVSSTQGDPAYHGFHQRKDGGTRIPSRRNGRARGDDMACDTRNRRQPLVGEQKDCRAPSCSAFGKGEKTVLIPANVEHDNNVAFAHVNQTVTPVGLLAFDMIDVFANDAKVRLTPGTPAQRVTAGV